MDGMSGLRETKAYMFVNRSTEGWTCYSGGRKDGGRIRLVEEGLKLPLGLVLFGIPDRLLKCRY